MPFDGWGYAEITRVFRFSQHTLFASTLDGARFISQPLIHQLEVTQALIASLFGEIFGWHTQENG